MALLRKNREATGDTHHDASENPQTREQQHAPQDADETTTRERSTTRETRVTERREAAYDRFGGINWGAAFFGWLVAVGVAAILTGIVSAILAGIGSSQNITQAEAKAEVGTYGIAAAVIVLVILSVAYYAGGYVSGRMSRFDGGKQGLGAWLIGVLITLIAVAIGAVAGSEYNILDRVNMPSLPLTADELGLAGVIAGLAILIATVLFAMAGGKVGMRYHSKVDQAVRPS